jgi:hypothetical protein
VPAGIHTPYARLNVVEVAASALVAVTTETVDNPRVAIMTASTDMMLARLNSALMGFMLSLFCVQGVLK